VTPSDPLKAFEDALFVFSDLGEFLDEEAVVKCVVALAHFHQVLHRLQGRVSREYSTEHPYKPDDQRDKKSRQPQASKPNIVGVAIVHQVLAVLDWA
jgi:hypothetical protein